MIELAGRGAEGMAAMGGGADGWAAAGEHSLSSPPRLQGAGYWLLLPIVVPPAAASEEVFVYPLSARTRERGAAGRPKATL